MSANELLSEMKTVREEAIAESGMRFWIQGHGKCDPWDEDYFSSIVSAMQIESFIPGCEGHFKDKREKSGSLA